MARKAGTISVDLEMKMAAFIKNTEKATAVLNSNVAQTKRSLNSIQQTAGLVQGAIAAWAGSQAVGAIKQVVDEFAEAQKSVVALNGALAATGRFSEETSQKIQDMAASMQQMTTADADELLQASATFAQFAKQLSGNEIANAQQAIIGLATVMKRP